MLNCPRDGNNLQTRHDHGVEVDQCGQCRGAWYDFGELEQLEATAAGGDALLGTIDYSKRPSELTCPVCRKTMVAFDYRATSLELDACPEEHGFWLDAGEAERVRALMRDRASGVRRAAGAQARWNRDRLGGFRAGGIIDRVRDLFRGR